MASELSAGADQWHHSALMATLRRVVQPGKWSRPLQTKVATVGLALLLGGILGALVAHVPPLYLFLGLGAVAYAFLLIFRIEIAILVAILLRNWLGRFNYLGGDTPLHPNGVIGVAIIASAAVFFLCSRRDLRRLRAIWPFLIFTVISFISLAWAGKYRMDGLTVALRLLTALAIYAVLLYKLDSRKEINWLVCVVIVAQLWRGVEGFFDISQGVGVDPHMAGTFRLGDSGEAAMLAMVLAFCVVQLLEAGTARRRLLWGTAGGFLAVGLFFSYGRGGWIGFGLTVAAIGLLAHRKLLVALPVILVLFVTFVPAVSERFSDIDPQRLDDSDSNTLAGRLEVWQATADVYRMHPLLGVGYGVGRYRAAEYSGQGAGAVHNDYLGVLAGTGLVGLAVFLLWQGQWFVELLRARRTARSAYERTLAFAVFALFLASLLVRITDNVLESTEKLYPLVALVAATLALPRIREGEDAKGMARTRQEVVPEPDVFAAKNWEILDSPAWPAGEQQPKPLNKETSLTPRSPHLVGEPSSSTQTLVSEQDQKGVLTIARGGGAVFAGRVAVRGLNYAYSAALVWGLGAESFGLFTLALTITTAVGLIANLGFGQGIVRFGAIRSRIHGRAGIHRVTMASLRVSLPVGLLFMLTLLASADLVAGGIFGKPELAPLIRALGLSVPFVSLQSSLLAATRALKAMKYSVYVWVLQPLAGLGLAVLLMFLGLGAQAVALSLTISYVLGAGLALVFYLRVIATTQESGEVISLKSMVRFSLPLSLNSLVHFANERTELLFLGFLPSAVDVGIYNIAWRMAGMETVFRESLEQIFAPFSSDLSHRRKIRQLQDLYKATAKWSFMWALMLFLIYVVLADTVMRVFDPTFVAGSGVLIALGLAQLINAATGPCGTVLVMSGRSDLSLMNTIVLLGVSIGLDWLLIPEYGLAGAALAGSVAVTLVIFLRVIEVWLTLRIHPFKWSFLKPIIAALSSAALVYSLRAFVYRGSLVADLVYAFLSVAMYIAVIYALKLDGEDIQVLEALRRKILGSRTGFRRRNMLKGRL